MPKLLSIVIYEHDDSDGDEPYVLVIEEWHDAERAENGDVTIPAGSTFYSGFDSRRKGFDYISEAYRRSS